MVITFRPGILRTGFSGTGLGCAGEGQTGAAAVSTHAVAFWNVTDGLLSSVTLVGPFLSTNFLQSRAGSAGQSGDELIVGDDSTTASALLDRRDANR